MIEKKRTLPRKTVLAKQGARWGAALLDIAIWFAGFLVLFYGASNLLFTNLLTNDIYGKIQTYALNSHLLYINETTQQSDIYREDTNYHVYEEVTTYYYFSYLTGENVEIPEGDTTGDFRNYCSPDYDTKIMVNDQEVLPKDFYTVAWYNKNVLEIGDDPDNEMSPSYFTYQKTELGEYDYSKLGIAKASRYDTVNKRTVVLTDSDIAKQYFSKYLAAYYDLTGRAYYFSLATRYNLYTAISVAIPMVISGIIGYIVVPLFLKDGRTVGKRVFKLALTNFEGYKMKNSQLLMRFLPFLITVVGVTFIPTSNLWVVFAIPAIMVAISYALSMGSPKKSALHDFTGRTIVIDAVSSVIYADATAEFVAEENEHKAELKRLGIEDTEDGEEPEISFEK